MKPNESSQPVIQQLADHLFRHESGKMISILTGIYGSRRLQLAEDVVQEALIRALRTWPYSGIPENPTAWLLRAAKNLAIDQLRRESNFLRKQPEIVAETDPLAVTGDIRDEGEVGDELLRLMFVCCHPSIPPEARSALALKTLCGFSPAEIASAFLVSEAAVSKRLTRARRKLQDEGVPFEIPSGPDLPARLDGVLEILYLLFNEGHKASHGDEIVRADLCAEAIRLATELTVHPEGNHPRCHALLALMCFTAARLPTRSDGAGHLLRLKEQDRALWDQKMIRRGVRHLGQSSQGNELSEYHLQAGIAACHSLATSDESTDWPRILILYDRLIAMHPSPVVALNRAVAISRTQGPDVAIEALASSGTRERLESYHLFHAVMGELEMMRGERLTAANHFRRALGLAETRPERVHLALRLEACEE